MVLSRSGSCPMYGRKLLGAYGPRAAGDEEEVVARRGERESARVLCVERVTNYRSRGTDSQQMTNID